MFFMLSFLGWTAAVTALAEHDGKTGLGLNCNNDADASMFCFLDTGKCSGLSLTLHTYVRDRLFKEDCELTLCDSGRCCCSINMNIVFGEEHNATVWRDGQVMESKIIQIDNTIKPKSPEIRPVEEVNGRFLIKWETNMVKILDDILNATVTYRKKGDTKEVSVNISPPTRNGLRTYEIHSQDLEPSTDYLVSVKNQLYNISSESSDEMNLTTPASPNNRLKVVIISLSVVATVSGVVIFVCFVKVKTKWWDPCARWPDSKLLDMQSNEEWLLRPELIIVSGVIIVPVYPDDTKSCCSSNSSLADYSIEQYQQSSRMGSGFSSLGYAKTQPSDVVVCVHEALAKAFPNICPSPLGNSLTINAGNVQADVANSKLLSFNNLTFSSVFPGCPPQTVTHVPEFQTQTKMLCDSGYHPTEGDDVLTAADQKLLLNLPRMVPSSMPVDTSYQQCSTDSGMSTLSYSSSNNANVEAESSSFNEPLSWEIKQQGKRLEGIVSDQSPFLGCLPSTGAKIFPPVIDDYQPV